MRNNNVNNVVIRKKRSIAESNVKIREFSTFQKDYNLSEQRQTNFIDV